MPVASDYVYDSYGFTWPSSEPAGTSWYSVRGQDTVYAGRGNDWCITVFDDMPEWADTMRQDAVTARHPSTPTSVTHV